MSGFQKSQRKNATYQFANIINGMFHVAATKETPDTVSRINKNDKEVWELITDELTDVFLHDVLVQESDFGKNLSITTRSHEDVKHEDNKFFVLNCALNSGYAYTFLNRVKSVDFTKAVTLKVFQIENKGEDDKTYKTRSLGVYQNDKMIEKIWTKENNPVPKAEQILDKKGKPVLKAGKAQWDDSSKLEFLENFIINEVQPVIRKHTGAIDSNKAALSVAEVDSDESDNLQF